MTDFIPSGAKVKANQAGNWQGLCAMTFALGEAFQFDWSEDGLLVGGVYYRMQVSHMKLCASGAFWLVAYPSQGHEMLFDAHTRSFAAWVAWRRGIYDNMKTAGQSQEGQGAAWSMRALRPCARTTCSTLIFATVPAAGEGRVEKDVQDSRRRIWVEAGATALWQLCRAQRVAGRALPGPVAELRHPQHKAFSIAEMLELEQSHLMPMPVALMAMLRTR